MINKLTLEEVEHLSKALAAKLSPSLSAAAYATRSRAILVKSLAVPFQTYLKEPLYKELPSKASALFYALIKDRPFNRGNRLMAIFSLMLFLYKNNKWLNANQNEFHEFAVWVASSPDFAKEQVIEACENYVRRNSVVMKENGVPLPVFSEPELDSLKYESLE